MDTRLQEGIIGFLWCVVGKENQTANFIRKWGSSLMCKTVVRSALPFFFLLFFLAWHTCHCNMFQARLSCLLFDLLFRIPIWSNCLPTVCSLEEESQVSSCTSTLATKNRDLLKSLTRLNATFNRLDTYVAVLATQSEPWETPPNWLSG